MDPRKGGAQQVGKRSGTRLSLSVGDSRLNKLVNDLALNLLRTRVRIPPPPPPKNTMFKWFKKNKQQEKKINFYPEEKYLDEIEESLWEIKDEYDLPTEEIINVVQSKRKNLAYMHETLSRKEK